MGCNCSPCATPSIVVDRIAVMQHGQRQAGIDAAAADQHCTGAAFGPWSQPSWCRWKPMCSRNMSSNVVRVSNVTRCSTPFTVICMGQLETPGSLGSTGGATGLTSAAKPA